MPKSFLQSPAVGSCYKTENVVLASLEFMDFSVANFWFRFIKKDKNDVVNICK